MAVIAETCAEWDDAVLHLLFNSFRPEPPGLYQFFNLFNLSIGICLTAAYVHVCGNILTDIEIDQSSTVHPREEEDMEHRPLLMVLLMVVTAPPRVDMDRLQADHQYVCVHLRMRYSPQYNRTN